MAKHMVTCRVCKEKFDTNGDIAWIMPSKNFYYHKKCYEDWKKGKDDLHVTKTDEEYELYITELLQKDLKVPVDWKKVKSQLKNFVKQGKTMKGIYYTLKYYYIVTHHSWEGSAGGIGIVPHVYEEATLYWSEFDKRKTGMLDIVREQLTERAARQTIVVKKAETTKKKYEMDWSAIENADE